MASLERDLESRWTLAFSPDGAILAIGGQRVSFSYLDEVGCASLWLWNLRDTPTKVPTILRSPDGSNLVSGITFSPDGTLLVATEGGAFGVKSLRLWNVTTGQEVSVYSEVNERTVAFSPSGEFFTYGTTQGEIHLINAQTLVEIAVFQADESEISSVALTPNTTIIAAASEDNIIRLWNIQTGQMKVLRGHFDYIPRVMFNPSGTVLASNSYDGTVRLWNIASGQQSKQLNVPLWHLPFDIIFTSNGSNLIAGDGLWNLETERHRIAFESFKSGVVSAAYSPTQNIIALGTQQGTVQIHNAATGEFIVSLSDHIGWVRDLAFSPDGTLLASVGEGSTGKVHIWAVPAPNAF